MYQTVLPSTLSETLTIEKAGAFVVLRQHPHKLKLGEDIVSWMYETLKKADPKNTSSFSEGIGVIDILVSANGVDIVTVSSTFHLNPEGYDRLMEWFKEYTA